MASLVDKFGDKMHSMGETIDEAMDNRPQTFSGQAVDVYRTASTGHAHALVDLVIHGADISLEFLDAQERTPLLAACTNGHLACAQILLERGANAAAIDLDGNTALHVACMHGRVEIVSMLLMSSSHVMSPYILNKKGQNALRLSRMIVQAKADGLVFDIDVDKPVMLYRDGDGLNRKPLAIGLESQVLAAFNEPGFEAWGTFFTSHMVCRYA
ncbi:hypothetical protein DYB30_007972 [Aphanomyces astaci]|uniref:Uncharacterized protein n=1 Tax=Aphanomyces astaci TaxID=112090 RepID=A0A397DCT6_APHAT|nr:hypothetical protein DYB30_007972 [Aphanomyces astaci]RHY80249.1 hypothetical protein DYB31_005651 [Aphanomyces astaci]